MDDVSLPPSTLQNGAQTTAARHECQYFVLQHHLEVSLYSNEYF